MDTLNCLIYIQLLSAKFALRKNCPYSFRMRENMDQNNSEYVHFSRSVEDLMNH